MSDPLVESHRPDLSIVGRHHIVGVGGPGMSAIALVLAEMGHQVRGSDLRETSPLTRLRAAGVEVHIGHQRSNVEGVDDVTISTAIPARNLEVVAARELGVPVLRRADMLAAICAQARSIGVAGTHGKTTTTSMLSLILVGAGLDPSFIVGAEVNDVGAGAHWSGGELLVVEADESDGTYRQLPLHATILTNVDVDHLDHFGSREAISAGFDAYLAAIPGPKVVCIDDPGAARLAARHDCITYGLDERAHYRAVAVEARAGSMTFTVVERGHEMGRVELPLRGIHMVRNATAAIAMARALGVEFVDAARALARFGGVARRFDVRGHRAGVTLVDDYAHLPAEIAAVLSAAARSGDNWSRVVAVFQPNRYSRMELLSPEYRDAFVDADLLVITDIYGSGESPRPGVTGKLVVDAVLDAHPSARVVWLPKRNELAGFLARALRPGDVCISMGCGDIAGLPSEVLAEWDGRA